MSWRKPWKWLFFNMVTYGYGSKPRNHVVFEGWPSTLRFTGGTGFWPTSICKNMVSRPKNL
jgi:hypothetical protein